MNARLQLAWSLLRQTFQEWNDDKVPRLGAALAFYTALSLAPLLLIVLQVATAAFGEEAARGELTDQMRSLVGSQGAKALESMIAGGRNEPGGFFVTLFGVATLLFGASGVFSQLQDSLNTIFEVRAKPGLGVWRIVRSRFLSFSMVLAIAFLLLTSLVVSAIITALGTTLNILPGAWYVIGQGIDLLASTALITVLFATMFKYLPDVRLDWRHVWHGAALTAVFFTVGKVAIGFYLGHSALASSYGVAGSFVVLLVWVYYAAQIFFFGAEFTQVYAKRFSAKLEPSANAEPVTTAERLRLGESPPKSRLRAETHGATPPQPTL